MNLKEQFNGIQHIGIRPMILKQPLIFIRLWDLKLLFVQ